MRFALGPGKAPFRGAFFVLAAWLLAAALPVSADCPADRTDEIAAVRHIHDGDTLTLRDGRRIRLIGVNTPELGRDGKPHQPLALRARDRLRQLVFSSNQQVRLRYGEQHRDRHGRTLAHLFLADGSNASARLLSEGLGWALAIPPNLWSLDCYLDAERRARQARRGVWSLADYRPVDSTRLGLRDSGFRLVRGRVVRVADSRSALWINLEGRFAIRIPRDDLAWFHPRPDRSWTGRTLEVRGWLYATRGELRVNLHHPASMRILDTD